MIDDLDRQIAEVNRQLRAGGADHPEVPLLLTVPGIGWAPAFTIAAEIGDVTRFPSPKKLCGYTGAVPGPASTSLAKSDRRGPLSKHGPKYLRWAMLEATMHALRHPAYAERYQRNNAWLRAPARRRESRRSTSPEKLTEAIWHMLTNNQPFAPAPGRRHLRLAA